MDEVLAKRGLAVEFTILFFVFGGVEQLGGRLRVWSEKCCALEPKVTGVTVILLACRQGKSKFCENKQREDKVPEEIKS